MSSTSPKVEATVPAAVVDSQPLATPVAPDKHKATHRPGDAWSAVTAATAAAQSAPPAKQAKSAKSAKADKPVKPVKTVKTAAATTVEAAAPHSAKKIRQDKAKDKPKAKPAAPVTAASKPAKPAATVAAKKAKPAPEAAKLGAAKPDTAKPPRIKEKLVRDSFTMPRADFALIHQLKERALGFKRATKKSELLRAGLQALAGLGDTQLQALLGKLTAIKAGRPKKAD